jgi:hypothetical protein
MELIKQHYERCWGTQAAASVSPAGALSSLVTGFRVLVFSPSPRREMWTYATCGMSAQNDAEAVELHLFSPAASESHIELLAAVAHYHLTGECLGLNHTVNFGWPWMPRSICDKGLISLPYLDGPALEWFSLPKTTIRFLWLIPVTKAEVEFKKRHGIEELESCFELKRFDYLNPGRKSVV